MGRQELVGIEISTNNLTLARLRISGNKKEIVGLLSHNIEGLSDADISKVLHTSFNEMRIKNPRIIDVIPPHLIITKNIEIPSTNEKEIKDIVNLQAARHTPYLREEIIVDYINLGAYKQNYTKILLVIIARSVIRKHFDILNRAGLKLGKVFLASEALTQEGSKILKLETEDLPVAVIHLNSFFTDFSIVFKNKLIFIRSIPIGVHSLIDEREKYEMKFIEEIRKSIEIYQNENIEKTPNTFFLTGAIEEVKHLETVLTDTLSLPFRVIPYLNNILISEEALKIASLSKRASFLNVIAPLLSLEKLKIDLIPEEIKLRRSLEVKGRDLIKTGIFILIMFILIFFMMITKIYFKTAYLKELNIKFQSLNQEAQKFEKDFVKISLMKNYLSKRGFSLEILTELHDACPLEAALSDIRFDDENAKLAIKGTAESMSAVFALVEKMQKTKYFKDVKTKYTSKRKDGLKDVTDFEVNCMLNKEIVP